MENQINTADQNLPQVGQNSVVQPVATPKTNYLVIGGVALVCSLIFGLGGYYLGKQSSNPQYVNNEVQTNPTATPYLNNPTPITNPSSMPDLTANWKTYKNDQYKFEFKYPLDGKLEISQTGYVRIQNYESNDLPMLKNGEYYVEFNLPPSNTSCKNLIVDPKTINQQNGIIYKGLGQEGGDAGGVRFALCAENSNLNLYLQVTENNQSGIIANQILSTFKLTQ